jgi:hypothetical protein
VPAGSAAMPTRWHSTAYAIGRLRTARAAPCYRRHARLGPAPGRVLPLPNAPGAARQSRRSGVCLGKAGQRSGVRRGCRVAGRGRGSESVTAARGPAGWWGRSLRCLCCDLGRGEPMVPFAVLPVGRRASEPVSRPEVDELRVRASAHDRRMSRFELGASPGEVRPVI